MFLFLCTAKGLNPDDYMDEEVEEFVQTAPPTLEDKLASASLKEIDELEVSEVNDFSNHEEHAAQMFDANAI